MKDVIYEVVVFNDQYGKTVRCRCDIERQSLPESGRQSGFIRHPNGVIEHRIPEKDQVRFGYVLASGAKREMTILADSLKALLDGLQMQTEAREMFVYINSRFGSLENFKAMSADTYDKFRNRVLDLKVSPDVSRSVQFLSPSVMKKIRFYKGK
jgi:hypothetical protein